MAQFKELYRNIEITIDIEPWVQRTGSEPIKLLSLIMRIYPVGWSINEAAAVITKHAQISDAKFYDFTAKNAGQLFAIHVFHNSLDEIKQWLDSWMHKEYREVIIWYFQSKIINSVT